MYKNFKLVVPAILVFVAIYELLSFGTLVEYCVIQRLSYVRFETAGSAPELSKLLYATWSANNLVLRTILSNLLCSVKP